MELLYCFHCPMNSQASQSEQLTPETQRKLSYSTSTISTDTSMNSSMLAVDLLLAISLSAASGFRVFVPFLTLSLAAIIGHLDLPSTLDWAETPQAAALFGLALTLEILGFSIPWFDHAVDVIATPAAVIAGTVLTAAIAPDMDPLIRWTLALTAGGGTAGATKSIMALLRGASTAISGGLSNPILALLELLAAIALSVLAITVPIAAGLVVLGLIGTALYRLGKWMIRVIPKQELSR